MKESKELYHGKYSNMQVEYPGYLFVKTNCYNKSVRKRLIAAIPLPP
jgi:hypothetical protein